LLHFIQLYLQLLHPLILFLFLFQFLNLLTVDPDDLLFHKLIQILFLKHVESTQLQILQKIKKSINNFNGYYRLGASYYNQAVDLNNQMNKLDLSQQKQYDALKVQRDILFKKGLPYLEKAHQLDANDLDTLGALKELYARLGQMDKSNEMKKQIDALKGQ